jgi:hypothetical protein
VVADVARASVNMNWRACGIRAGNFQSKLKADAFAVATIFEGFARKAGPVDLDAHEAFPVLRRNTTRYLVHAAGQFSAREALKLGGGVQTEKRISFQTGNTVPI